MNRNQPIAAFTFGSGSIHPVKNPLGLQHAVARPGGWPAFVREVVGKWYAKGYRRFLFHQPYGHTPGGPMDLDQKVTLAESRRFVHVPGDLREALAWSFYEYPDAVFLMYLGTSEERLAELIELGHYAAHAELLLEATDDLIELPNVDLGLDASAGSRYADGSPMHRFAEFAAAYKALQGRLVFTEALSERVAAEGAALVNSWSAGYPSLCTLNFLEKGWAHYDRDPWLDRYRLDATDELPIVLWGTGHSARWLAKNGGAAGMLEVCKRHGMTPAWGPGWAEEEGWPVDRVEAYLGDRADGGGR